MAAALPALLLSMRAGAQELKSVYFLDDFVYKYELNPAMHDEQTTRVFVGFGLNNIGISAKGNVGLDNFIFPTADGLVYFMNDAISYDQFLGPLPATVNANINLNLSLLSFGFKVGPHGFLSFDTRVRSKENVRASKDFFAQLKGLELSTSEGSKYTFSDLGISSDNYLEQAIGYSFQVADGLRLGVTLKGLFGLASARTSLSNVDVEFVEDDLAKATAIADMSLSTNMLKIPNDAGYYDFTKIGFNKVGISGFGGALDLGIHWESKFGLSVSAAVLDLGGIAWKKGMYGHNEMKDKMIDKKPAGMESNEYAMRLANQIFGIQNTPKTDFEMLPTAFNVGLRYKMPFYQGLSVGFLGNYELKTGHYDVRAALTISPARWFSFTANYGWTDFGGTFGAAMNLRPGPFTFFIGAETAFYNFANTLPFGRINTTAKMGIVISVKTPKTPKS